MGVPSFYRWLVNKYPKIVQNVVEEKGQEFLDISCPNPNGFEFDNLYLDMNGIVHPCFHPENQLFPPTTVAEVFENIYLYIDRLVSIVRPRKLLYLAIDGVAPRAKQNQQRARRFRAAKDNEIAEEEEKRLREDFEKMGKTVLPKLESEVYDSNVITPGTAFMYELSKALECYINKKLRDDPGWKEIKVILSDASVPGEGEHKIMSFIRSLRTLPGYNPNTRHCLYGLDADLIMLALSTHEIHFSILREEVLTVREQMPVSESALISCIKKFEDFALSDTNGSKKKPFFDIHDPKRSLISQHRYQFLHVWILREYLELDMQITDPPDKFVFDIERIIDDFIFICFFAGNDFLPDMPTVHIHENGIDLLMHVYKKELKRLGGYLVDMQRVDDPHAGYVKLKRVERFILSVGSYEDLIFKKRTELVQRKLRRILSELSESQEDELDPDVSEVSVPDTRPQKKTDVPDVIRVHSSENASENNSSLDHEEMLANTKELKEDELDPDVSEVSVPDTRPQKKTDVADVIRVHSSENASENNSSLDHEEMLANTKELKEKLKDCLRKKSDLFREGSFGLEKVKLGSVGWKQRYYKEKFSLDDPKEIEVTRKQIVEKYAEGLCWVLLYYFSGVPSWSWYYPYHYAPFASDLKGLAQVKVKLQKGLPFRPFDQLMAVLPPRSAHALPKAYRELMLDSNSSIIEFYPNDIEVDHDGKRFHWQGICKLPFIQQEALLNATRQLEGKLEEAEAKRNIETNDLLFMRGSNRFEGEIWSHFWLHRVNKAETQPAEEQDEILSFCYKLPVASLHVPRLLEGVQPPDKIIFENDIMETPLWHENTGSGSRPISRANNNHCWWNSRFPAQNRHRGAMNNVMKMEMTNEVFPYRLPGPGRGRGFNSVGRGKTLGSNLSEPNSRYPHPRHQYPTGYRQSSPPVAVSQAYAQNPAGPVCYRPTMAPGPGCGFNPVGRGKTQGSGPSEPHYRYPNPRHQYSTGYRQPSPPVTAFQVYAQNPAGLVYYRPTTVLTPASNYANGSHQRAAHCVQNSSWSSRSGGVVSENRSWRSVVSSRPSDGSNPQPMGRGRGTGHYRPSTYDRSSSSQYPNQRDPNRW